MQKFLDRSVTNSVKALVNSIFHYSQVKKKKNFILLSLRVVVFLSPVYSVLHPPVSGTYLVESRPMDGPLRIILIVNLLRRRIKGGDVICKEVLKISFHIRD